MNLCPAGANPANFFGLNILALFLINCLHWLSFQKFVNLFKKRFDSRKSFSKKGLNLLIFVSQSISKYSKIALLLRKRVSKFNPKMFHDIDSNYPVDVTYTNYRGTD
jgi:hypothetical protein